MSALPQVNQHALEIQALAFYPSPYVASPGYAIIQTPWYLDYGHLVF